MRLYCRLSMTSYCVGENRLVGKNEKAALSFRLMVSSPNEVMVLH